MDAVIEFVKQWGYVAVFIGALVEGESVILAASALSVLGILNIYTVGIVAFFATLFAEQSCYMVGRKYGMSLFEKYPRFKPSAEKAFVFLKRFDVVFILTCRFIYGIRTISPFVVGAAQIPPQKFIPLNILAAAIWSVLSCWGGYELGELIIENYASIEHFIKRFSILLPFVLIGIYFVIKFLKTIINKKNIK